MRTPALLFCGILCQFGAWGCGSPEAAPKDTGGDAPLDADGDGATAEVDCDDAEPARYPGAPELCDGLDNDCDITVDEDAIDQATYYSDFDGDGYGDPDRGQAACAQPAGMVRNGDDCDDAAAEVRPFAVERCDEVDRDCDGLVAPPDWAATLRRADGSVEVLTEADSPWVVNEAEALEICAGTFDATVDLQGGRVAGLDAARSVLVPTTGPAITLGPALTSTVISDLRIEDAVADRGAAVRGPLEGARTISLVRLELVANTAEGPGGAVSMAGTLNVSDTSFLGNAVGGSVSSCLGGAVWVDGDLTMVGGSLQANVATCAGSGGATEAAGGALWVSGQLTIEEVTVTGNRAALVGVASEGIARGGAVWAGALELRSGAALDNNVAEINLRCDPSTTVCAAWAEGGAAWVLGTLLSTDATLTNNAAQRTVVGDGLTAIDGAAIGGAIYATGADLHLLCDRVRPCGVTGNQAEAGTGLWWEAATGRLRSDDHDWDGPGAVDAIDGAHTRSPGANASFTCTAGAACTEG